VQPTAAPATPPDHPERGSTLVLVCLFVIVVVGVIGLLIVVDRANPGAPSESDVWRAKLRAHGLAESAAEQAYVRLAAGEADAVVEGRLGGDAYRATIEPFGNGYLILASGQSQGVLATIHVVVRRDGYAFVRGPPVPVDVSGSPAGAR